MRIPALILAVALGLAAENCRGAAPEGVRYDDIRYDEWIYRSDVMPTEDVERFIDSMKRDDWQLVSIDPTQGVADKYTVVFKKPDDVKIWLRRGQYRKGDIP